MEAAFFRVASRIRYRLQLFNNLSFDQLDRLRIELKMKNSAQSNQDSDWLNEKQIMQALATVLLGPAQQVKAARRSIAWRAYHSQSATP